MYLLYSWVPLTVNIQVALTVSVALAEALYLAVSLIWPI